MESRDKSWSEKLGEFVGDHILAITFVTGMIVGSKMMKNKMIKQSKDEMQNLIKSCCRIDATAL